MQSRACVPIWHDPIQLYRSVVNLRPYSSNALLADSFVGNMENIWKWAWDSNKKWDYAILKTYENIWKIENILKHTKLVPLYFHFHWQFLPQFPKLAAAKALPICLSRAMNSATWLMSALVKLGSGGKHVSEKQHKITALRGFTSWLHDCEWKNTEKRAARGTMRKRQVGRYIANHGLRVCIIFINHETSCQVWGSQAD